MRAHSTLWLVVALMTHALRAGVGFAGEVEFNRDVRPILSNHCFKCHGPDSATREAGLRIDQRDAALQAAESGRRPIVPGDAAGSELIRRVVSDDVELRMPPLDGPQRLSPKQIDILRAWIEQGAEYEPHWSFVPLKRVAVPTDLNSRWPISDVDRFVLARLQAMGRRPAPEASRETLIRRVSFALTGLPPTLEEIDVFLTDRSPHAYRNMVDRYLESPAYGEHMARHWLDLARYADTNGYQYDTERQQWVWRDWVIDAYNRNKPFDEFTVEQLAGDLLPDATPQQRLATGFHRNHGITIEGGIIDEEYRTEYVMDRLVTTSAVWLGLTAGCARCHDHKFDPISQREFYELYAFFNQVPERGARGFAPNERIPSPLADSQQADVAAELARLKSELKEPLDVDGAVEPWAHRVAATPGGGWSVLTPSSATSSGGSTLKTLEDHSLIVGGANPGKDVYEIAASTKQTGLTAVRLETLTHDSLPGGGPGRHSNSNFVLSEFELTVVSVRDRSQAQRVKFARAVSDYSQQGYEIGKAIDGVVAGNNGWAVDGPTRKKPATAMFIASSPFGFEGGSELRIRLRHEANFATHGIGRPRLSVSSDAPDTLRLQGIPKEIHRIASTAKDRRRPQDSQRLKAYFLEHHHPRKLLQRRLAALEEKRAAGFPATMIMQDMADLRPTFILNRGQYNEPTELVSPGVPAVFPPLSTDAPANRLALARWLVRPDHPLTARVAVNRYWQRLFGVGLVKTSEDFGVQGELPSHPALLDWLAGEFLESGWDVKHMQRLIVMSATWRQASNVGPEAYRNDPQNRLLARGPRLRLAAEEIRDAALAVSGLLVQRVGGASVYPYQPKGLWMELNNRPGYSKPYQQGAGDDLYRRSIYTFWKRTVPSPMLKTFDAPEREFCTVRRSRTNTPLQALLLLNGPQFVEAARTLAQRMASEGGPSFDDRIAWGFRRVTSRAPDTVERRVLGEAFASERSRYAADAEAVNRLLMVGDSPRHDQGDAIDLAALTSVARLLLNLDEAINRD